MSNSPPKGKNTRQNRATLTQDEAPRARTGHSTPRFQRPTGSARLKNPTSTVGHPRQVSPQDPARVVSRLKNAIRKARQMQHVMKEGDEDVLIQSTLIQGLLSGDVMAASIRARLKLQRENQRMRRRLTLSRIRTEEVKQRLLSVEADAREKPPRPWHETLNVIREIYGLAPMNQPLLPQSSITAEVISGP